jgi:hypothetical protein
MMKVAYTKESFDKSVPVSVMAAKADRKGKYVCTRGKKVIVVRPKNGAAYFRHKTEEPCPCDDIARKMWSRKLRRRG